MIPAAFEYRRATSLDDALTATRRRGRQGPRGRDEPAAADEAAAGRARHARRHRAPDRAQGRPLHAGRRLRDRGADDVRRGPRGDAARLRRAIASAGIGDIQVRNRGTVGGAIAHADPASDLPALGLALDYEVVLRSQRGERVVPLDGFLQGAFTTDIAADEILTSLRRGPLPAGAGGSYQKLEHPASGYSIVGVCAVVARSGGSVIARPGRADRGGRRGLSRQGGRGSADGQRRFAGRGGGRRRARGRRSDRQRRHPRGSRLSSAHGGGLHPSRDRSRARPQSA